MGSGGEYHTKSRGLREISHSDIYHREFDLARNPPPPPPHTNCRASCHDQFVCCQGHCLHILLRDADEIEMQNGRRMGGRLGTQKWMQMGVQTRNGMAIGMRGRW